MEILVAGAVVLLLAAWLLAVVRDMRSRDRWAITERNWDPRGEAVQPIPQKREEQEEKPEDTL